VIEIGTDLIFDPPSVRPSGPRALGKRARRVQSEVAGACLCHETPRQESSTAPVMEARKTSILARFAPTSNVTTEQYDETIRRLEKSGDWLPEGLEYHVAFKSDGKFRASEIWDSREQFDAFGERLMPVLKDVGIEPGKPEMLEIHNIIKR
jgi:hypothetical protein